MHRFPPADTFAFLIGLEIGQVCLDPWSTQFRFADGGQITIEGSFEYIDISGRTHAHQGEERDRGPVSFRELLQTRIVDLDVAPFALTLTFDNGGVLRLFTDEGAYECGQVSLPGQSGGLIVF